MFNSYTYKTMKKTLISIMMVSSLVLAGCSFHKIENGDKVHVVFTGTFADQNLFEAKDVVITQWSWNVAVWIEKSLLGMKVWQEKTVTITPEQGYGNRYSTNKIQKIPSLIFEKAQVSTNTSGTVEIAGLKGVIKGKESDEFGNQVILFDLNTPETWQDLTYTIKVLSINE